MDETGILVIAAMDGKSGGPLVGVPELLVAGDAGDLAVPVAGGDDDRADHCRDGHDTEERHENDHDELPF